MTTGTLFLIPVPLGPTPVDAVLPASVIQTARGLTRFVAENAKSARAFLKTLPTETPLQQIAIQELNEHTPGKALPDLLAPLLSGHDVGLISEAGCPAIADPGAALVALAHEADIPVVPFVGPSSILLALMGSGLSGQNFSFHGYLPAKDEPRRRKIQELERESRKERRTQLFIETPYRNRQMLQALIDICAPGTRVCIASNLTLPTERILTRTTRDWKTSAFPDIEKQPTVFLLQA